MTTKERWLHKALLEEKVYRASEPEYRTRLLNQLVQKVNEPDQSKNYIEILESLVPKYPVN
jgi:hypothetical protein